MFLTKDNLVKARAKENGYPLNQTVELVETLLQIIKIIIVRAARRAWSAYCGIRDDVNVIRRVSSVVFRVDGGSNVRIMVLPYL
jgi:hypothetical protein